MTEAKINVAVITQTRRMKRRWQQVDKLPWHHTFGPFIANELSFLYPSREISLENVEMHDLLHDSNRGGFDVVFLPFITESSSEKLDSIYDLIIETLQMVKPWGYIYFGKVFENFIGDKPARNSQFLAHKIGIHSEVSFTGVETWIPGYYNDLFAARYLIVQRQGPPVIRKELVASCPPRFTKNGRLVAEIFDKNVERVLVDGGYECKRPDTRTLFNMLTKLDDQPRNDGYYDEMFEKHKELYNAKATTWARSLLLDQDRAAQLKFMYENPHLLMEYYNQPVSGADPRYHVFDPWYLRQLIMKEVTARTGLQNEFNSPEICDSSVVLVVIECIGKYFFGNRVEGKTFLNKIHSDNEPLVINFILEPFNTKIMWVHLRTKSLNINTSYFINKLDIEGSPGKYVKNNLVDGYKTETKLEFFIALLEHELVHLMLLKLVPGYVGRGHGQVFRKMIHELFGHSITRFMIDIGLEYPTYDTRSDKLPIGDNFVTKSAAILKVEKPYFLDVPDISPLQIVDYTTPRSTRAKLQI